jgi:hypothetical protein
MRGLDIVDDALKWLGAHYFDFEFFYERDIVWTLQCELNRRVRQECLPLRICHDIPMLPPRRTDLALVRDAAMPEVEVAIEFKYEPSHARSDIPQSKLPVCFWDRDGVLEDTRRIREFVAQNKAYVAMALFIDEGGHFAHRHPPEGSNWEEWERGVRLLRTVACQK